jgi:undecaprenyl-diphosphatase
LLPGLSRSGLTIAMALALGLRRPIAAQYRFFVAIPTILLAAGAQAFTVATGTEPLRIDLSAHVIGFAVAAVSGAVALAIVLKLLYQARFRFFAVYVWALAAVVLVIQPPAW